MVVLKGVFHFGEIVLTNWYHLMLKHLKEKRSDLLSLVLVTKKLNLLYLLELAVRLLPFSLDFELCMPR